MWNLFDQWIVLLALGWASWIVFRKLTKKAFSCDTPCEKKIFDKKAPLVSLGRKAR